MGGREGMSGREGGDEWEGGMSGRDRRKGNK